MSRQLDAVQVTGSDVLLARLVANLLDNAVRHNETGGLIAVATEADGPIARLTVQSGGRLMTPEQASALAEPFRRLEGQRTRSNNGVGLGLAIVSAIAAAHHGTLHLRARPDGGLSAVVELPAADPPATPAGSAA